ncbi:MAG TPA: I78 family peptidase inhibitor [Arenimonas sp.]|uniref:I78 family peptidase inhibitor n=1 Tax=Arenimonas sp. TaxID=1872635 RepID=UPI002D7FCA9E|nr:I78 family peptidase inhibitor [Arenimonas sp.]HEU0153516.1 I78 family peptidase inhibitor [Arenimonas sp.]
MTLLRSLLFAASSGLALAACASPPAESAATPPPATEETPMTCQADKGQWAVGQIATDEIVLRVRADTTSASYRVIAPGMAVTMDYREDRVNLDVDAENRITAVRCG